MGKEADLNQVQIELKLSKNEVNVFSTICPFP